MKSLLSLAFVLACGVTVAEEKAEVPGNTVLAKLEDIVIPKVEMDATPVGEAWSYASMCATKYDPEENEVYRGITFILKGSGPGARAEGDDKGREQKPVQPAPDVTYHGKNVRLLDLLRETGRQGRVDVYLTEVGMIGVPEGMSPFPNAKAKEGEVWKVVRLRKAEVVKQFLETAVLREVDFKEATVKELMDFLRLCALELDPKRVEAKEKGVSIIERRKVPDPGILADPRVSQVEGAMTPRITLSMRDASFGAVLKEVARQAKLDAYLTTMGVLLRPAGAKAFADEKEQAAKLVEMIYRYEAPGEKEAEGKPGK